MCKGSKPRKIAIVIGITFTNLVTILLSNMLTFFPQVIPIIILPAIVSATDDAIHDESRVTRKISFEDYIMTMD
jgi:hypothetical protein